MAMHLLKLNIRCPDPQKVMEVLETHLEPATHEIYEIESRELTLSPMCFNANLNPFDQIRTYQERNACTIQEAKQAYDHAKAEWMECRLLKLKKPRDFLYGWEVTFLSERISANPDGAGYMQITATDFDTLIRGVEKFKEKFGQK